MPKGIYVIGSQIKLFGFRGRDLKQGEEFHAVTDVSARQLLRNEENQNLAWNGTTVVQRDQFEIDDRLRTEAIAQDDARFEREREKAILLVLLDEINVLRDAAGLSPHTIEQAKSAYVKKLNR